MESQIIDYYNEMPYGVNVIEKMIEEHINTEIHLKPFLYRYLLTKIKIVKSV